MTAHGHPRNVLFLCTGNSARSIIAEAVLREIGDTRFRSFSAGSHPTGRVNPLAFEWLRANGVPVEGLRSKSWDEFAAAGAPELDFVITVCDNAAGEACPVWPGRPANAHWGVPDPAAIEGGDSERRAAFAAAGRILAHRIRLFVGLPFETLDRTNLATRLADIGRASPPAVDTGVVGRTPEPESRAVRRDCAPARARSGDDA